MSSLANIILFLALVTTSIMVAVMYRRLKRLDRYHIEYQRIFDQTGEALKGAQDAVVNFGAESRETLAMLSTRIEEAHAAAKQLEALTLEARRQVQSRSVHSKS